MHSESRSLLFSHIYISNGLNDNISCDDIVISKQLPTEKLRAPARKHCTYPIANHSPLAACVRIIIIMPGES